MRKEANWVAYYKEMGQLIRAKREKGKKSQEQLSRYLGFESRISIAHIESGKQKVNVHVLAQIASYLKVDIKDLLPDLENHRKGSEINPELEKSLNKEGITDEASEGLKDLILKVTSKTTN